MHATYTSCKILPMNEQQLNQTAKALMQRLLERSVRLATVESCTGGWVAKAVTDLAGSSAVLECGFVTYSNEAKQRMVGVSGDTLATHGAVSEQTAAEMASGALEYSAAEVSLSITGVAGPTGGSEAKPVGTVCFGWAVRGQSVRTETCHFQGDRDAVRYQSAIHAIQGVVNCLSD